MDWLDKVPQHYRPRFERWIATNPDQASRDGIRRLVEAGKVAVALKTIEDSRLMKLMTFIVKRIAKQFDSFVRDMRSERMFALIVQAVEAGNYQQIEPIIDSQIRRFANVIPEVFQHAGRELAADNATLVRGIKPDAIDQKTVERLNTLSDKLKINSVNASIKSDLGDIMRRIRESGADVAQEVQTIVRRLEFDGTAANDNVLRKLKEIKPTDTLGEVEEKIQSAADELKPAISNKAADEEIQDAIDEIKPTAANKDAKDKLQNISNNLKAGAKQDDIASSLDTVTRGMKPSVGVSFDPYNPRAAQAAQQQQYDLIRLLNQEQKEATRSAVISAVERGLPPRLTAREISRSIGLTPKQLDAVQNYRKALEDSSKSALNRALRDRRFDRSVERAADGDKPLTAEQIDKMVERYTERYIRYRAETIAITEGTEALSRANHEAMLQTIELADISPEDVEKEWNSTQDGRTRPSHVFLNRKKVQGINALFTSGLGGKLLHPGDRKHGAQAKDIIRCRCVCAYRIRLRGV